MFSIKLYCSKPKQVYFFMSIYYIQEKKNSKCGNLMILSDKYINLNNKNNIQIWYVFS